MRLSVLMAMATLSLSGCAPMPRERRLDDRDYTPPRKRGPVQHVCAPKPKTKRQLRRERGKLHA